MARQTRQQRRERRTTKDGAAPAVEREALQPAGERGRQRAAQVRPQVPPKPEPTRRTDERAGPRRFVQESWGELQKVEWPGQRQVVQGTVVVLVACLIVGLFLYASDQAFKHLVEQVFLR